MPGASPQSHDAGGWGSSKPGTSSWWHMSVLPTSCIFSIHPFQRQSKPTHLHTFQSSPFICTACSLTHHCHPEAESMAGQPQSKHNHGQRCSLLLCRRQRLFTTCSHWDTGIKIPAFTPKAYAPMNKCTLSLPAPSSATQWVDNQPTYPCVEDSLLKR